jgi:pimeloyl-ACP methyl ester carboxylesterase
MQNNGVDMTNKKRPTKKGISQIEGRSVYGELWGSGSPTVIYETGSLMPGTNDSGWLPIRNALTADYSVFVYDRAGLGMSEPAPLPRPLSSFTTDLHNIVRAFELQPPYVLVGGSFGGMLVMHYASLHPADIMGVLLVDSTHPEHNQRALSALPPEVPGEPYPMLEFRMQLEQLDRIPPESNEWEGLDVPASIAEARERWNLHNIPLIVLTAGLDEWEPGFPADTASRYTQVWLRLQEEMAALSTNSQHHIVADSDHMIHDQRPDIVIESIRELIKSS